MKKGEPLICVNRPILLALVSANHTSPLLVLNATIPESELAVGIGNSLMEFSTVVLSGEEIFWMQAILFVLRSVKKIRQSPTKAGVIPKGPLLAVGTLYSVMMPVIEMRPILLPTRSVNQKFPSCPLYTMLLGSLVDEGSANSVIEPSRAIRPILPAFLSVNHIAPSGPLVIPKGPGPGLGPGFGRGNSVIAVASGWNKESSLPAGDCAVAGDRPRLNRAYPITATAVRVMTKRRVVFFASFIASP